MQNLIKKHLPPLLSLIFFLLTLVSQLVSQDRPHITNPDRYFSPNLDGQKDQIEIPIIIKEQNLIGWTLFILKKDGRKFKRVKSFQSFNPKEQKITVEDFFKRIIERDEPVKAPPSIKWDGTDTAGNQVDDGVYYFTIDAIDRNKNRSRSPYIPIIVDTVTPKSSFEIDDDIFSPNQDGVKENLTIEIENDNFQPLDQWKLEIIPANSSSSNQLSGQVEKIFQYQESGEYKKGSISWKGDNNEDAPAPEGFYNLKLTSFDLAGNTYVDKVKKVELVRTYEAARLDISADIISPNSDSYYDDAAFQTDLTSTRGLLNWKIELKNETGNLVRTISNKKIRKILLFNGRDNKQNILPDGIYTAKAKFYFRSGNYPESNPVEIEIDNTSPKIELKLLNQFFNPKAKAGGNRTVSIEQTINAKTNDRLQGVMINQSGEIVWQTNYESLPNETLIWNGKQNNGEIIAGKYIYSLTGEDVVGNATTVETSEFEIITGEVKAGFIANNHSISPNNDKAMDTVSFTAELNNTYQKILENGLVKITAINGQVVKTFQFEKSIPEIIWDGKDDNGKKLADGIYRYQAEFSFTTKEKTDTIPRNIYLDTTPVSLIIELQNKIFSPNNDGNLDELIISNIYQTSELKPELDQYLVQIKNTKGVVYQQQEWEGKAPRRIIWRGQDQLRNQSPTGYYYYQVKTTDHAQNIKTYKSDVFRLVNEIETVELQMESEIISSHPQAKITSTTLGVSLSDETDFLEVQYVLYNQSEELVLGKSKKTRDFLVDFGRLRSQFLSAPKGERKKELNKLVNITSGPYLVKANTKFASGNRPDSPSKTFWLDNNPPEVKVNTRPEYFSPDGDGINEMLDIRIQARDNLRLKKLTAFIFRKVEYQNQKRFEQTFANYYEKQLPMKIWSYNKNVKEIDEFIKWDGRGELGNSVESATEYILYVRAEDEVGIPTIAQREFTVDILVERLKDGRLKIIINNINFKYNSADMLGNYQKVLKLLYTMLNRFPEYKISVEGHTDSRGSNAYNKKLSLTRAKKVKQYLIKEGIDKTRLSAIGRGESQLQVKNEVVKDPYISKKKAQQITEDNYRQNRRVEFFLKKPKPTKSTQPK